MTTRPSSLSSAALYLNDSALQLSVTDHVFSDGLVLIKSIVLDPNFGPPNNDSPSAKIQKKDPPGPFASCSSVDQVSYTRSKEYWLASGPALGLFMPSGTTAMPSISSFVPSGIGFLQHSKRLCSARISGPNTQS